MSAGLPLLIVSTLAVVILVAWLCYGSGQRRHRVCIASLSLIILLGSWVALLTFGVFHPVGLWGMASGFAVSIASLLVPVVYNRLRSNEHT